MAFGKNSRVDSRRSSSSYCSVITVVLFVALCLVGVWMMTSSSVVPDQNVDLSSSVTKSELNPKVVESDSRQFEDSSGDVPDDGMKEDIESHTNPTQEENSSVVSGNKKKTEYPVEENKVENISQDGEEVKNVAKDTSKRETQNDGERKADGEGGEMGTEERDTNTANGEKNETGEEEDREKESEGEKKSDAEENSSETGKDDKVIEEVDQNHGLKSEQNPGDAKIEDQAKDGSSTEVFPDGAQSEILNETTTQNGAFLTQALESKNEKEAQEASKSKVASYGYSWNLCNVVAGPDYIPCLDNEVAIRKLPSTRHYEHRERHCPEEGPTCLVPLPEGYKQPIQWPNSRDKIWYHNVPHTKLAAIKGHQNWVKVTGEYLTFPGGGTQFKNGALHYIDFIQESLPDIAWGKRSRVVLDVGCGVASFGGYLFERDVLTLSFAPKDEHEAQVQFALERGIPAISAVMGTKRLPFPGRVFDIVHCARCRVPWHIEGGKLLLELNRVLRPGGYFVWSATPVYRKGPEDAGIWDAMLALTKSMCWELLKINEDKVNEVGAAIFKKPTDNNCYKGRSENNPPLCPAKDDPNAAWNIPLEACLHRVPEGTTERGSQWPEQWPLRLEKTPYWLNDSQIGVYGRPAPEDFTSDYKHWKRVVSKSYLKGMGISWSNVRNVMDMRSVYGGFAAALRDMKVWVMNVVSIDAPDTLPLIYERGLFGMYHDWCESFSTYPRTYDLIHADHLFSKIKKRCKLTSVIAEVDRILRPEGKLIVRDNAETINEIENMVKSLQWEIRMTFSKDKEGLLCVQKSYWRPQQIEAGTNSSSMA